MPTLYHNRVALSLRVKVAEDVIEQHMPVSVEVVGQHLAREVSEFARRERLGYYPALSYFEEHGGIDPELVETARNVAWLSAQLVRDEVRTRLRPVFSNIRVEGVQSLAFTMPPVRPRHPNALISLTRHLTPDEIKLDLVVTMIQKRAGGESLERFTRHVVKRWLAKSFDAVEVTSARAVGGSGRGGEAASPLRRRQPS